MTTRREDGRFASLLSLRMGALLLALATVFSLALSSTRSAAAYVYDGEAPPAPLVEARPVDPWSDQGVLHPPLVPGGLHRHYDHSAHLSRTPACPSGEGLAPRALLDDAAEFGSTPAGRPHTYHYGVETGPTRNIPGSVVDEAIDNYPGKPVAGGKTVHYDPNNNVTVVTGRDGAIVSVHKGPPRASQR